MDFNWKEEEKIFFGVRNVLYFDSNKSYMKNAIICKIS